MQFEHSFFLYIYTNTTGFQTFYGEKQYDFLRNHISNLSLDIYDNLDLYDKHKGRYKNRRDSNSTANS